MDTELGDRVEWTDPVTGGFQVGHMLVHGKGRWYRMPVSANFPAVGLIHLVLPYGDSLPKFVPADILKPRPSHEVLNNAK